MERQNNLQRHVIEIQRNPSVRSALLQLACAHSLAASMNRPLARFAVDLNLLQRRGGSITGMRWLLSTGYAEHFLRRSPSSVRLQRVAPDAEMNENSWFLPTAHGLEIAGQIRQADQVNPSSSNGHSMTRLKPHWDDSTWELRLGNQLIKRYTQSAPNQFLILQSFQELNWRAMIDSPLLISRRVDPHKRLLNAVQRLNHGQLVSRIRFHADAGGKKIRWELI